MGKKKKDLKHRDRRKTARFRAKLKRKHKKRVARMLRKKI